MALLSGQIENGWEKSTTTSNLVKWEYNLTHTSSTSSAQSTSLFPSEVIQHIFREFSNIHISVNWGTGTKTTTFSLGIVVADSLESTIELKEIFASASRNGDEKGATLLPRNLYSSDGSFIETTHLLSPHMYFLDLASAGTGTNTVSIVLTYAPANIEELGEKYMGDVFRGL
tara:strand:- start:6077 stop:6592 length:516 start_codon:yes stop_codon:yes gene_type:complete